MRNDKLHSASATPYLAAILTDHLDLPRPDDQEIEGLSLKEMKPDALHATYLATKRIVGVEQEVDFFAKRLLYVPANAGEWWQEDEGKAVLLGSPVYVALLE